MVHEALASLVWPKFGLFKNLKLVQKPCQSNDAVPTSLWLAAHYSKSRRITRAAADPAPAVR